MVTITKGAVAFLFLLPHSAISISEIINPNIRGEIVTVLTSSSWNGQLHIDRHVETLMGFSGGEKGHSNVTVIKKTNLLL